MKFTVLGKYGAVPGRNGACSSYLVEAGKTKLLLDCGSGALSRLQNYCKIDDLDAIVLTHLHSDHISDMFPLRYYLDRNKIKMPVYLPLVAGAEYDILSQCDCMILNPIIEGISASVGDMQLKFYRMVHKVESYSVRVESEGRVLVYSGDTEFNDNIAKSLEGAHAYLADCAVPTVVHESEAFSHMSVSEGVLLTKPSGIPLYITHHFNGLSVKLEAKNLYDRAVVVEEGKSYKV